MKAKRSPKTAAERARAYRARQAKLREDMMDIISSGGPRAVAALREIYFDTQMHIIRGVKRGDAIPELPYAYIARENRRLWVMVRALEKNADDVKLLQLKIRVLESKNALLKKQLSEKRSSRKILK